jgi:hypothetical protein
MADFYSFCIFFARNVSRSDEFFREFPKTIIELVAFILVLAFLLLLASLLMLVLLLTYLLMLATMLLRFLPSDGDVCDIYIVSATALFYSSCEVLLLLLASLLNVADYCSCCHP